MGQKVQDIMLPSVQGVLVLVQGVQGVCRECRGVQGCAGRVQAATHGVLASVQGGVQKVQVPCTPCTDGSIISGAGECRRCRHTLGYMLPCS